MNHIELKQKNGKIFSIVANIMNITNHRKPLKFDDVDGVIIPNQPNNTQIVCHYIKITKNVTYPIMIDEEVLSFFRISGFSITYQEPNKILLSKGGDSISLRRAIWAYFFGELLDSKYIYQKNKVLSDVRISNLIASSSRQFSQRVNHKDYKGHKGMSLLIEEIYKIKMQFQAESEEVSLKDIVRLLKEDRERITAIEEYITKGNYEKRV